MSMQANYKPIVVKTLLEKGFDASFTASIEEVKENIIQLNFDRENFEINDAITAVMKALSDYVIYDKQRVSLNYHFTSDSDILECLKICGQKIADWHIEKITKSDYEMWHILPGSRAEDFVYLDEFIETNTIGVGWNKIRDISNLSDLEIEKTFEKYYDEGLGSFQSFTKIKPKDIVVLTRGQEEIIDFGIITSDYEFLDVVKPSYPHRKNIVWLNQGPILASELPRQSLSFIIATCGKLDKRKQEMVDVLLNTHIKQQDNQKYFILTQNSDNDYEDTDKQYHFQKGKPGSGQLKNNGKNAKFIIQSKIEGQNYFVGYGIIGTFSEKTGKNNEGVELLANYSTYKKFEEPKVRTENIHRQMKSSPSYGGRAPAILPISRSLYMKIIGEDLTSEEDGIDTMSMDNYERALDWKPNLILYGPPGTGKTYHANEIAKRITSSNKSNRSFEHILTETLQQPTDIHQMSDDEYRDFIIDSIKNESEERDYIFTEINTYGQYALEKNGQKIHIDVHSSASTTQNPVDLYVGISQTNVDFLKQVPEDNRFIIIINHSCKNFVVLPYSIEQKQKAEFSNSTDGNWDPTGVNAHSFHILIDADKVNFKRQGYDCKKFMRNINMIFSNETIIAVTFHPSFSYEDFIEGFRPDVDPNTSSQYILEDGIFKTACNIAKINRDKKIVLIIDEINRGNIPKILGELITLIEKDKRKPENSLKLPYSKDDFFVPKNLIIIGTMNTADKSLMQMDDALKRRFVFEELMPDTDLLKNELKKNNVPNAEDYSKILRRINEKITGNGKNPEAMVQFRDRQIGHSYFWKLQNDDDLQKVIKYDIIPLLQDYFYGDYSKIREILSKEKDNEFSIIGKDNRTTDLVNDVSQSSKLREKLLEILQ